MKAWFASAEAQDRGAIIFADTRQKARAKARRCDGFENADFYAIRVVRCPEFDDREDDPPSLEELVRHHNWWTECRCGKYVMNEDKPRWKTGFCVSCKSCRNRKEPQP